MFRYREVASCAPSGSSGVTLRSRSRLHGRGLTEASLRNRKVAALSALHRLTFLSRRAADVRTGGKVERRNQPVACSSTDRQLHARRRSREVRARVFVPGLLADVTVGCVKHSARARTAPRFPDIAPARPRRRRWGAWGDATRERRHRQHRQRKGSAPHPRSPHSITWSASTRIDFGIVTPRVRAVLRLQISSNVVG